jgi:two-component system, NarL family, invasion response regulator UvrY
MSPAVAGRRRLRVGIVDDHAITRRALQEFLSEREPIEVVGVASTGGDAMELARTVPMDVMLLDIDMPGRNGIDALPHILAREPAPAVLMLSSHPPAAYGVAMIKRGAAGYLNKQCDPEEIVRAIEVVAGGRKYIDEEVGSLLVESVAAPVETLPHRTLTEREFQIFLHLAKGHSSEEAARHLSLSPNTVSTYRVKVMEKVRARTNSDLTYYALKHHLIA